MKLRTYSPIFLLSKIKPIRTGILHRRPDQSRFLERLTSAITSANGFDNQEVYILGDLNINIQELVANGIKRYCVFCSQHSLKQLIISPTRTTMIFTSLFDHNLAEVERKSIIVWGG